jgi:hypothetical protein
VPDERQVARRAGTGGRARQRDASGDGIGTSAKLGLHTDGTFPRFGVLRGDKLVCLQCSSLELPPTVISRSNSNWNQETADVSRLLEAMTDSRFCVELDGS